jgi:hypothetical protein
MLSVGSALSLRPFPRLKTVGWVYNGLTFWEACIIHPSLNVFDDGVLRSVIWTLSIVLMFFNHITAVRMYGLRA